MCILIVCIISVEAKHGTLKGRPQVKVRILCSVFLLIFFWSGKLAAIQEVLKTFYEVLSLGASSSLARSAITFADIL